MTRQPHRELPVRTTRPGYRIYEDVEEVVIYMYLGEAISISSWQFVRQLTSQLSNL